MRRPSLQDVGWSAARERRPALLAADHQSAGELAWPDCADPHDSSDDRAVLRQLPNPTKAHKLHLDSDRTSCSSATANQFRLLIHVTAYWLMHSLRDLAPKTLFWRNTQFDIIRLALIKTAVRLTKLPP
jgi:hypothetical protein